jgi:hypothetical protein
MAEGLAGESGGEQEAIIDTKSSPPDFGLFFLA